MALSGALTGTVVVHRLQSALLQQNPLGDPTERDLHVYPSGGYGAIMLAMRHPGVFGAVADHSDDAGFELCYLPDFSATLDAFREARGPAAWLDRFWADPNRHRRRAGIVHHYEEFDDGHMSISYRYDVSIPLLVKALDR